MHVLPRKLLFFLLLMWIGLLSLPISLLQFNKYKGTSDHLSDCDTDSELVFVVFAVLLWLSSLLLCIWIYRANPPFSRWLAFIAIAVALLACGNTAIKTSELITYNAITKAFCSIVIPIIIKTPANQTDLRGTSKQTPKLQSPPAAPATLSPLSLTSFSDARSLSLQKAD